jgi:hypothetical protein
MVRPTTLRLCAAALLAAFAFLLTACPSAPPPQAEMSTDDLAMLRGAQLIADALRAYQRETAEWPATIREAEPFLLRGEVWPVNPYDGQPVVEAASAQFDPAASVGKVFYEKFVRDGVVINYRLHVFGKTGVLKILDNTPETLR